MRYSDEELRRMKARRRELVAEYGDKGQHHPMGRMIGGLNPAAQELYVLRGKIIEAESERRGPSPVLTPLPGSKGGYGLKFDVEYQGRRGKLGTDNFGRWYIIIGEGSAANVIASDLKTKGEAAKAFARLSGATREGASRQHATKKSPAQLQREIDEVLAKDANYYVTIGTGPEANADEHRFDKLESARAFAIDASKSFPRRRAMVYRDGGGFDELLGHYEHGKRVG